MPTITQKEQDERRETMLSALGSQRLEGLEPDEHVIADSEKWVRGEMEIAEVLNNFLERVKRGEV